MKKLYCNRTSIILGVIHGILIVGMVTGILLFPLEVWFLVIPLSMVIFSFWYMVGTGQFLPIHVYDNEIKYRGVVYKWEDIKITAYPSMRRSYYFGYYLVFGTEYLFNEKLKKQIRQGFWVFMLKKELETVLQYYKKEVVILDCDGQQTDIIMTPKKVIRILQEHNAKYE